MSFVNWHCHSEYSLLDGLGTPKQRAKKAVELGQGALSISDHGNLCGIPQHIKACGEEGIKPLVGVEAYFKPDRHKQDNQNKKAWHLLLTAKNNKGWHNLIKLISEAQLSGFYYKPCVDWELLQKYGEGIICSSACISGYLPWLIQKGDDHGVADCIEQHLNIFGDDYRLEIMPHDVSEQKLINTQLANLSMRYSIPILATIDSHYPVKTWSDTQDIICMIATGQSLSKRERQKEAGEDVYEMGNVDTLHFMDEDEVYETFVKNHPDLPTNVIKDAIEESALLAERVETFELDKSNKLPKVSNSEEEGLSLLKKWCNDGMKRIGKQDDQDYIDRLEHELSVLKKNGVIDYFIIVGDMVRWARAQNIRISSGRGSAAGSLVSYLCNITRLDPISHGLLFERFLNPDRKGLPDIDLDFDAERRHEVKEYLGEKYGVDHVCDISAFGTYGPKSALKDVARVLDVPFPLINAVTAVIPEAKDVGGAGNIPPLIELYDQHEIIKNFAIDNKEVWKHALRIEGQTKQLSKHAGGVIICDKPITDHMPLLHGKTSTVTGWSDKASMPIISDHGFLKIDVLSIDGLTKQGLAIKVIEETENIKIDLDDLPVGEDPLATEDKVMKVFQKGLTLGTWQFGSKGMTSFLKHTKPDKFSDLAAINALYRPGPLDGGDAFEFGDRKTGKIPIEYWHPLVKPYLEETYGILCYQEQMMEIVKDLGGFTPSQADDMRKATSKLYRMGKSEAKQFMADYEDQFKDGCLNREIEDNIADLIWDRIVAFGGYSFNKSHAASYALISYQDGWLKTNYPLGFYSALLTYDPDRVAEISREARQLGINIKNPDINISEFKFTVDGENLLYGLQAVKYIGDAGVKKILENRPFKSIQQFEQKCRSQQLTSRAIDNLKKCGAFDEFGVRDNWTTEEKRKAEEDSLGVALSGVGEAIKYAKIIEEKINTEEDFDKAAHGTGITVGGEFSSIKQIVTKTKQDMAFGTLVFKDNSWECTFFPKEFAKYKELLSVGKVIMMHGRKDDRGSIICDYMTDMETLLEMIEEEE